jgi:glycosyltransferase involved in cell wall biosynthesis
MHSGQTIKSIDKLDIDIPNIDIEVVILPKQRLWTHRALRAEIQQHPPDLLFIPAHVLPFSPAPRRQIAAVVTIHDLGYHWFPAAHTWFQRLYLPVSTRWNAAAATHIITPSAFTAQDLTARYGTAATKISVIHEAPTRPDGRYTAVDMTIDMAVDEGRAQYRLPPYYALYVGTLQPRKNLRRLLLAYAKLVQQQKITWHLVLAGAPGWQPEDLTGLTTALAISERVHFLGYVPDEHLSALYRGAQFFAFPSLFEGFGLPVLEAQSYGVPVMTANNSSLPEIAGDAALLVDPTDVDAIADAMLRLSVDEPLRQQLIDAGYANASRFSWEKAARETLAVFEKVLGQS